MPGTSLLKRKGLNNLHYSQTNGKKYRVEEPQPTAISVISVNDKERIAEKKRAALENLKRSSQKRKATEDQMVIEREKKGQQRAETYSPELKKQRMSEETNVLAQEGLSKRQKTEGQSGCAQLACSTHKGIS